MRHSTTSIVGAMLVCIMLLFTTSVSYGQSNFSLGDRVQANQVLNVRSTPGGTFVKTVPTGSLGTLTAGPQSASYGGILYTWWEVHWDEGTIGWSVQEGLDKIQSAPTITGISPNPVTGSDNSQQMMVSGTGFQPTGMNITLRDVTHNQTYANRSYTFVSSTQIEIIPTFGTYAATWAVQVTNSAGQSASWYNFNVVAPVPTITSMNPTSANAGGPGFTLTVNGNTFTNQSVVRWMGYNRTTIPITSGQFVIGLRATIPASDISSAGNASVTVYTPSPGGGTSNSMNFNMLSNGITITGIAPNPVTGSNMALQLTVYGTGFQSTGMNVTLRDATHNQTYPNRSYTFVSSTQIEITPTFGTYAANWSVQVTTSAGQSSSPYSFTVVAPVPTIMSMSPTSATAGGAGFTLTVNGATFTNQSIVRWNGSSRTTIPIMNGQFVVGLQATIPASDIASAGNASVTVYTPSPGGGTSNSMSFTISQEQPSLPDLTISTQVAEAYSPGQTVQLPVTVSRTGGSLTGGTYVIARLYWSSSPTWNSSDSVLWESNQGKPDFPVTVLNSVGSNTVVATITIPTASQSGTSYLIAYVDPPTASYPNGFYTESNKTNNIVAYSVAIRGYHSPAVTSFSVSPTQGTDGHPVTATFTVVDSSGLEQAELWRTTDLHGAPDTSLWKQVAVDKISGIAYTGAISDTPSAGTYWYGLHVRGVDMAWSAEPNPPGPIKVIVTPRNAGPGWTKLTGPWSAQDNGAFSAIAVDPANPQTMLIGSESGGGIFKSTDAGASWESSSSGLTKLGVVSQHFPAISQIVYAPSDPSIVYAGTAYLSPTPSGAVYRSTDGGNNWTLIVGPRNLLGVPEIQGAVTAISVDCDSPNTVFAGVADQGVYKSTDAGTTWNRILPATVAVGAVDFYTVVTTSPTTPNVVYVAGFRDYAEDVLPLPIFETFGTSGVMPLVLRKSTDGGKTWSTIQPSNASTALLTGLVVGSGSGALVSSSTAYMTPVFIPVGASGILRSTDDGNSWNKISSAGSMNLSRVSMLGLSSDPSNRLSMVASAGFVSAVFASTDDGVSWRAIGGLPSGAYVSNVGTSAGNLFALTTDGVYALNAGSSVLQPAPPVISDFHVQPDSIQAGQTFTASFSAEDSFGLERAELWIAPDKNGLPDTSLWTRVKSATLSGQKNYTGTFASTAGASTFWVGVHVVSSDGSWSHEQLPPGPARITVTPAKESTPSLSWTIGLKAMAHGLSDSCFAGVADSATAGFDAAFDIPKPAPPPSNFVYIAFPIPQWNIQTGSNFQSIVKPDTGLLDGQIVWNFEVATDQRGRTVNIRVRPDSAVPDSYSVLLMDLTTGNTINCRADSDYTYVASGDSVRIFELIVGSPREIVTTHTISPGWSLVGVPGTTGRYDKSSVFPGSANTYLYGFSAQTGSYFAADSMNTAQGYWLGVLSPITASIQGNTQAIPVRIELHAGFNLVSSPSIIDYPSSSLLVQNGRTTISLDSAVARGWVSPFFYTWQAGDSSYTVRDTLVPWEAYWFAAIDSSLELDFQPPQTTSQTSLACAATGGALVKKKAITSSDSWFLSLGVNARGACDNLAGVGVSDAAASGFNPSLDIPCPPQPPAGKYVQAYFRHPNWSSMLGSCFSRDIRQKSDSLSWKFFIRSSMAGEMATISWDSTSIPGGIQLYLIDLDNQGHEVDMKQHGRFQFTLTSQDSFLISSDPTLGEGEQATLPTVFSLSQNYPNPFNPTTTIGFDLPTRTLVTLKVYDVLGRQVITLVDHVENAGYHKIVFDGSRLASGVYFYRIAAGNFIKVRKMLLVK